MKLRAALAAPALVALIAAAPQARAGAVVPDPRLLFARERASNGLEHRPASERELWNVREEGLDGTIVVVRSEESERASTTLGPFRTARGSDHGVVWHQNENGETVIERSGPATSEEVVARNVVRVHAPVDAWQLTTTYRSGHVVRTFFDARDYAIVRIERSFAGKTEYRSFDDFRSDALGRRRPWHEFGGEGSAVGFDYHLVKDELGARVDPRDLAIPPDRRALVEFPAAARAVRLPARFQDGRIVVRLSLGGRGLDFLLDSGSSAITLDSTVARQLRLPEFGRSTALLAGMVATSRTVAPRIDVGGLSLRDVVMRTMPLSIAAGPHTRIVGLLGFDFLDQTALQIDYANGAVTAFRPGTPTIPADAMPLRIGLASQTPNVRATVGVASGDDFILDTGADFSLVLFGRFTSTHPPAAQTLGKNVFWGAGIGGAMAYRELAPQRLTLDSVRFERLPTVAAVAPDALGLDEEDGLIGNDVLQRFTVYFDYAAARVYLERSGPARLPEARAPRGARR